MAEPLVDRFGRPFSYLRLSLEDACNFRCLYCLPNGYRPEGAEPSLSLPEIRRLVAGFADMGLWKVRLTGGEPTVRRDIVDVAEAVAGTAGVRRVSLSTNGYRLVELARSLRSAGVAAVNVSVDSLERDRFRQITGHDRLAAVLAGVERCLSLGFETKINVVLLKDLNEAEIDRFVAWTRDVPVAVRFIELMPTGDNLALFSRRHLSAARLVEKLLELGWTERPRKEGDGPARSFARAGHLGTIGVIAPYSKDFCSTCNRLRVTSRGRLRLCLFADGDASLRPYLKSDDQLEPLRSKVRELIGRKESGHSLPEGRLGDTRHFAMMGG